MPRRAYKFPPLSVDDPCHDVALKHIPLLKHSARLGARRGQDWRELWAPGYFFMLQRIIDYSRRPQSYTVGSRIKFFLAKRLRAVAATELIKGPPGSVRIDEEVFDLLAHAHCRHPDPSYLAGLGEVWEQVDRLPPEIREVLRAKFDQGLSGVEIAKRMGISRTCVSQRMQAGFAILRRQFGSDW